LTALGPLLDPASIVIVGASPDTMRTGGIPIDTLLSAGFPRDRLLLVNPKYPEIAGLVCYPSCDALPWAPELAVLAVPAECCLPVLEQAHAVGIRAAVLFASGFAEDGSESGAALQDALVRFAVRTGMLVSGPNCLGHANLKQRSFPTFLRAFKPPPPPGPVAMVSQSGNMLAVLGRAGRERGLRFSYMVNTGNEACLELSHFLQHFAADPDTQAVVGYVEQVRDGSAFLQAAAALRRAGKPLLLLKAGRSTKGAQATASHTAAMAGSAQAYAAAFRQLGVAAVADPTRLIDLAYLWRLGRLPAGRRAAIVSLSGAACAILADACATHGIEVPTLDEPARRALRALVPTYGMIDNPVDLTGQITNDRASFGQVMDAVLGSPAVDLVLLYLGGYLLELMAPALVQAVAGSGKPVVVIDMGGASDATRAALDAAGLAYFTTIEGAAAATGEWLRWQADWQGPAWEPAARNAVLPPVLAAARDEGRAMLTEAEAKDILAEAGLPTTMEVVCASADEAFAAALRIGWPVAVKVLSPDIAHKTEVDGVRLGVADEPALRAAFAAVTEGPYRAMPDARINGVLVQRMAGPGVPMLLGVTHDEVFGPMLTAGLGGVLTELLGDVSHRLLPVDEAAARAMLGELRGRRLLDGYRGAEPADVDALVSVMTGLSDLALRWGPAVAEIEVNPVLIHPCGATVVDALVRLARTEDSLRQNRSAEAAST